MDLICVVCGRKPREGEHYVKLEKWYMAKGGGGVQMREPVMICLRHLPQDINESFGVGGFKYRQYVDREVTK